MKYFTSLIATLLVSAALAQTSLPATEAEVRKVDKDAGKITLKHGEIRNLDMPPMSMVFQVRDKSLLDKVKAGDRISFTADKVDGAYTVLSIGPSRQD